MLLAGTGWTIAAVTSAGPGLTPWQLVVPVLLYGAGLGLGASSLMLITLSGADRADAGAVSGVVNTVVQLGVAAGPATIGTAYFGRLAAGGGPVDAARDALLIGLVLFGAALVACALLPRPAAVPITAGATPVAD
jgi:hypothetical protein